MMKCLTSLQRQTGKTSKYQKHKKCSIRILFLMRQNLSWKQPQALEPHMDKTQIRAKKDDAKYAKV
jgi:hypothetical protein